VVFVFSGFSEDGSFKVNEDFRVFKVPVSQQVFDI
jgi:hypothetical protein